MISAAGYARTQKIPYLGLCYGMQLAVVSYARDVLGWKDANTTENVPDSTRPIIHMIPTQEELMKHRAYGGTMRLGAWEAVLKKGSRVDQIYFPPASAKTPNHHVFERHRHRYEFNDVYTRAIEDAGLVLSGRSKIEGLVEFIELPESAHPFYIATQGHPEYKSRPLSAHPLFVAFIEACKSSTK
jgi:CTP synthase